MIANERNSGKSERVYDSSEDVRRAFAAGRERPYAVSGRDQIALRDAVCALVRERKGAGVSVEGIIIELRRLVVRARAADFGERAAEDAVRWCIAEYYARRPV